MRKERNQKLLIRTRSENENLSDDSDGVDPLIFTIRILRYGRHIKPIKFFFNLIKMKHKIHIFLISTRGCDFFKAEQTADSRVPPLSSALFFESTEFFPLAKHTTTTCSNLATTYHINSTKFIFRFLVFINIVIFLFNFSFSETMNRPEK